VIQLFRPLVALDLETTGTNSNIDRIVQIGIVKVKPDGKRTEWETLVNPEIPIPPEVVKVHGITDAMVAGELPFSSIGPMLAKGIQDCDLCGYNIAYDIRFLKAEFKRCHYNWEPNKVIDSYKIFQTKEKRDLSAAVKFFLGKELEDAHTALADARASLEVFEAQLERYEDLPRTINEIHYLLWEKVEKGYLDNEKKLKWHGSKAVLTFGKHSGKSLQDLPKDYMTWIVSNNFPEPFKKIINDALQGKFPEKPL
jgi:DNA polymerase-3 subunit epsilon